MGTKNGMLRAQTPSRLSKAAGLSELRTQAITPASTPHPKKVTNKVSTVQQTTGLGLTFFFDGTGNNLEADLYHSEHSNVARLFRLHCEDNKSQGIFSFYIPGIGTRFKEIGDPGGTTMGNGFGARGDDRLEWAMRKLDERTASGTGTIQIALFGFSRGATLARAFARRIAARCELGTQDWTFKLKEGGTCPIRLYFMGLFDTVASVGIPMSTNNEPARGLSLGILSLRQAMKNRQGYDASLAKIAFGDAAGADPAPGVYDGHMSWADGLAIPPMVERCVHMVAMHEIRNSFPLDSILQDRRYPVGGTEIVYPGAHSDVGGGYRAGEGARSTEPGSMLSLLPLREMRRQALEVGVPLMDPVPKSLEGDLALDAGSQPAFQKLVNQFKYYLKFSNLTDMSLGEAVLASMKIYYQWRFHRIARNQADRTAKKLTKDQLLLKQQESQWSQEEKALRARMAQLMDEVNNHRMASFNYGGGSWGYMPMSLTKDQKAHLEQAAKTYDEYLATKARYDTLPGVKGKLGKNLNIYDDQLLADARLLRSLAKTRGRSKLRPHYRSLLEAYEAEFVQKNGLKDAEIIAFFDTYVHDSLADFGQDATLPSDPRVIYIGADDKLQYAINNAKAPFDTATMG